MDVFRPSLSKKVFFALSTSQWIKLTAEAIKKEQRKKCVFGDVNCEFIFQNIEVLRQESLKIFLKWSFSY